MDNDSRANRTLTSGPEIAPSGEPIPPALEMRGITKRFPGIMALDDVSIVLNRGSVHALLGENGAGKTTLMRIAFGLTKPDSGSIERNGTPLKLHSPADAIAAHIGMVHQQFSLVPAMTVAENVALGGKGTYRFEDVVQRIRKVERETGLRLDPSAIVRDLSSAERQKLEIVRTLAHSAEVLILDEPTAVLTPDDIGELFGQIRKFADGGGSVVLITHKLGDAIGHADTVSVLRRGNLVLNSEMSSVTQDSLARAMLGSTIQKAVATRIATKGGSVVTRVEGIEVREGEILGIAALDGAAAILLRELANVADKPADGFDSLHRVGFVPEKRQEEGIVADFTLTENFALKNAGARRGRMPWKSFRQKADRVIRDFDVRAPGPDVLARTLSGGNQQRFIIGRELSDMPALLVLENPTQGLDVNAAMAVHERMLSARSVGTAVVFYSSDLDELAELSDRVAVVSSAGVAFANPDRDEIGRLLLGADPELDPND